MSKRLLLFFFFPFQTCFLMGIIGINLPKLTYDTTNPVLMTLETFAVKPSRTLNTLYKTFLSDAASFEAIAKGSWSPATEDASFRGGFRRYGAAKLFLIMMQHELQARLDADPALNKICVLGVDPGTMISGLQRLANWVIRVLIFQIIYPLILYWNPNGPVRPPSRSAGDVLEAAFGVVGEGGNPPKDGYFDGRVPLETSGESRDVVKRELVWKETVRMVGLEEGETVLVNWR